MPAGHHNPAMLRAMGTDRPSLLESSSASDALSEFVREMMLTASKTSSPLSVDSAARLCGRLAVIVRHDGLSEVEAETPKKRDGTTKALRALVRDNRTVLDAVAPKANELFDVIGRGDSAENAKVEPLITDRRTHAALQTIAEELLELIEDDIESPEASAYIYVLGFIAPHVELPSKTLKHLLRRIPILMKDIESKPDLQAMRIKQRALEKLKSDDDDDDDDDDDEDEDE